MADMHAGHDMHAMHEMHDMHDIHSHILFDIAHAIGKADAKHFHEKMGVTDPIASGRHRISRKSLTIREIRI